MTQWWHREGRIRIHDTSVMVWEEHVDDVAMLKTFQSTMERMKFHGFKVTRDPEIEKHYKCLGPCRRYGRLGDLEFNAEQSGRTMKVMFYQNVANVENRNGGRYDFDKMRKMPRLIRLQTALAALRLIQKWIEFGYTMDFGKSPPMPGEPFALSILRAMEGRNPARADPLADFNQRWEAIRFERDERGWPTEKEYRQGTCGQNVDRDKKPIFNGQIKYVRRNGRLFRGTVFTNMNDMWGVYSNGDATWKVCRELFDCERPDLEPRRAVDGQPRRMEAELKKAVEVRDFKRVAEIATALKRVA
ncbi:MAG: hypothetical protein WC683_02970 [bacterium]